MLHNETGHLSCQDRAVGGGWYFVLALMLTGMGGVVGLGYIVHAAWRSLT